ncbi:MAG: hypothetical protein U1E89_05840 [Burkholderiaceae bacterium]
MKWMFVALALASAGALACPDGKDMQAGLQSKQPVAQKAPVRAQADAAAKPVAAAKAQANTKVVDKSAAVAAGKSSL